MRKRKVYKTMEIWVGAITAIVVGGLVFGLFMYLFSSHTDASVYETRLTEEEIQEHERRVAEELAELEQQKLADEITAEILDDCPVFKPYKGIPLDDEAQQVLVMQCQQYHVGLAFALAIMESESSFVPGIVGDSGRSIGYMQINKPNWNKYGLDASYDFDNIEIGVRMLSELIDKYQECDAVIMAYKGGESAADEWLAEGIRLDVCDKVVERTMFWQKVIDGNK